MTVRVNSDGDDYGCAGCDSTCICEEKRKIQKLELEVKHLKEKIDSLYNTVKWIQMNTMVNIR